MYKIFGIEQIGILNGSRWAGNEDSVTRSNDGKLFFTQLRTGVEPEEGEEGFMNIKEIRLVMQEANWKKELDL